MDPHNQNQLLNQRLSRLQAEFILIDHGLCPDWSREEHTRRRDCLYLILDGKGKITVNGNTFYPEKKRYGSAAARLKGFALLRKRNLLQ